MKREKYYISTAITYTSGKPHIGNTYEIILADCIARFRRMQGFDVYFQTGTDEHGQKIQASAEKAGIKPQQFVDKVAGQVKTIWDTMNTTYDRFVRTSDPLHKKAVQDIFQKLYDKGDIYKDVYKGMYCQPCESFFTDSQLVDGKCPDCGREVTAAHEQAYFFRLSKYAKRLEQYINDNAEFIHPEPRKKEMINNFIKAGLQDLCVSRTSFSWGVPVPFDPEHIIYVWIDALSNYITFLGYDVNGNSKPEFLKYWPCDMHLIGKDIVRFHTIYWPALLMALDLPLPKMVFGHPWLIVGDGKMSKSKGNVLYADELAELFGTDAVRFFVLSEIPYASDGIISYELMIERINTELANILGNLVNRTVTMSRKYFDGIVKSPVSKADIDNELISICLETPGKVTAWMDEMQVSRAIEEIFALLRRANKYIDETQPWILGREGGDADRLATVLYNLLESIRFAAVLLSPFMPATSQNILAQLGSPTADFGSLNSFGIIQPNSKLCENQILFARIDAAKKLAQIEAQQAKPVPVVGDKSANISIDDFAKIDLCVAKILSCEYLKGSDKLLRLVVDTGSGQKQVLSAIAEWYTPQSLIGKKIILVNNLAPAKLRGALSEGMLLSADKGDNAVEVIFVQDDIEVGAKIR